MNVQFDLELSPSMFDSKNTDEGNYEKSLAKFRRRLQDRFAKHDKEISQFKIKAVS